MSKPKSTPPQCEGYRRYGGAFTFGPVTWRQCENQATVVLKFKDGKVTKTLPACQTCWEECIENNIKIISAKPIASGK